MHGNSSKSVMFSACRPVPKYCEFGHVIGEGEFECEEGHSVVEENADEIDDSFIGQLKAAVQWVKFLKHI